MPRNTRTGGLTPERISLPPIESVGPDVLVSTEVAAAYLGISGKTLRNRVGAGNSHLPAVKLGSAVRYRMGDIRDVVKGKNVLEENVSKERFVLAHGNELFETFVEDTVDHKPNYGGYFSTGNNALVAGFAKTDDAKAYVEWRNSHEPST